MDNHAVLKCDPGQVIEIDESFYGRNSVHYCRANRSHLEDMSVEDRCTWVDVVSVVSGKSFRPITVKDADFAPVPGNVRVVCVHLKKR